MNTVVTLNENSPLVRIVCSQCQQVILEHSGKTDTVPLMNISKPLPGVIKADAHTVPFNHFHVSTGHLDFSQSIAEGVLPQFDQFTIQKHLGSGGTGNVYLAENENKELVAIKLLHKPENPEMLEYFIREAQILFQMDHPNIVRLKGQGNFQGSPYIVMEYIKGKSLEYVLKKKRLPPLNATNIVYHVLKALKHAYQFQVIHRDIKPGNILLTSQGEVKVIDLGLCKIVDDTYNITNTGQVMGTMFYMPPEQFMDSKRVDHCSDIYATGATLYHALSGVPPYEEYSDDVQKLLEAKSKDIYIPLEERHQDIPPGLIQITKKAMAHKPKDRYSHPQEMRESLSIVYKQLAEQLSS